MFIKVGLVGVGLQGGRPGGNAPLPFMGRTIAKGRFRFRFNAFAYVDKLSVTQSNVVDIT